MLVEGPEKKTVSSAVATFADISVSAQDVVNCSYSQWYNKFSSYTYTKAEILRPVPIEFINYLLSDDIILPKDEQGSSLFQKVELNSDNEYSDWEEEEDDDADADADEDKDLSNKASPTSTFPSFHQKIKDAIQRLGGKVAPKLNWTSPQDATWMMMNNTMECHNATELYLLLKSSDYINHDIGHAFECVTEGPQNVPEGFEYELVLRKWFDINPSMEFRCFVRDRQLIAISPRDLNYYTFMKDFENEIVDKIDLFFDSVLLPKFDSNSFAFDVYIPKPLTTVYLVDVNPFARQTDSLLFSWNELATMKSDDDGPLFRKVEQANSGRFASRAHSQNQVPKEIVDASLDTEALVELAQGWDKMMKKEDGD
ncbi:hypothetical protein FOA43_002898 [Brettanomyces nanus]|uniref:Translation initiation factor eIF2 assembly protein n=1 Tax=Eeniella nana TaxID=13502 RepID=A0A875S3S1_EENNA|nr:uncharacterized protein FOA43_002898 [Brettanomyces nanus]QPG75543.1 hypothetical protein FOA43_002898 [Brettanomyces nanus]